MSVPRLAVLTDFLEEGWPSMDLCAEMLLAHLGDGLHAEPFCPSFRRRWGRIPFFGNRRAAFNADRFCNRYHDYPVALRRIAGSFDLFHIVDHSYAHLVHSLPPDRVGIFCHDLNAFRCLLGPAQERRPRWFRALMRHVLRGLQLAACVFHSTVAVRQEIERFGLVDPARLVLAPYGPAAEFTVDAATMNRSDFVAPTGNFLLHVGSCIRRKRIDVLLAVFAALRKRHPALELVQVGGTWAPEQAGQLQELGIAGAVRQLRGLPRQSLAALYGHASLVLQPSADEGFGLPVLEALACGAAVLASDLPSLREVGGAATSYCPVGDIASWTETAERLLTEPATAPDRAARLQQAGRFSWAAHARTIADAYRRLAGFGT